MNRDYVAQKIGSSESIWDRMVGQIHLGSATIPGLDSLCGHLSWSAV